jgi:hypothetical protein
VKSEASVRKAPRFSTDDPVYFSVPNASLKQQPTAESFVIVSVMPSDQTGNFQYRIKPIGPGPNRIASELELRHRQVEQHFKETA